MHKVLMVVRREYLERVKKKSFWIGLALFPILMAVMIGGQFLLMRVTPETEHPLVVVDGTGGLFETLGAALAKKKLADGSPQYPLEKAPLAMPATDEAVEAARREAEPKVYDESVWGVLTISADIEGNDPFHLYTGNVGNIIVSETIENGLEDAVVGLRLKRSKVDVDRDTLDRITAPVDLQTFQVSRGGEAKKKNFIEAYFGTFAFVLLLYTSLLIYGIAVMRGILEEKSNRVMEVLLGPLTPSQLMTGKIVGIGLVGLTQMGVYMIVAGIATAVGGVSAAAAGWTSALDMISPTRMLWLIVFFLLGYAFFVALFAAIGAVCNTEQEAQNLQGPVTMCLVLPMVATFFFVNNPDSKAAIITSFIPIFTPMVMYMRICVLTPPLWQILLSILIMIVTIALVFRGVAKIFRIGILMYGKRPTLPEILRWARS